MNEYVQNFQQMGIQRDNALLMIFGVCLTFVLAYLGIDLYKFLPLQWRERGKNLILAAFAIFYFASWFSFLLQ